MHSVSTMAKMDDPVKCCFNPQLWLHTGCLCGASDAEIPDADIIMKSARNPNIYEGKGGKEHEVEDEVLMNTASTFLLLWDFGFSCNNNSGELQVCNKLFTLLSRLQQDSTFLKGVEQMLYSENKFVSYVGSKLLARILLTSPPEGQGIVEHLVLTVSDSTCATSSPVSMLTVLCKMLKHSHTTIHPHLAEHRKLEELSSIERSCDQPVNCVNVDCTKMQHYVVDRMHLKWSCLMLRYLFNPFHDGLVVAIPEVVPQCQSTDGQQSTTLQSHPNDLQDTMIGVTSFLQLWECLYKFVIATASNELITDHYMVCQDWKEIFSVIWLLRSEAGNLLLSIINSYFQYPSACIKDAPCTKQDEHQFQLAKITLTVTSSTSVWDKIPVYGDVRGFGGVVEREQSPSSWVVELLDPRFIKICLLSFKAAAILINMTEHTVLIETSLKQVHDHTFKIGRGVLVEMFNFDDDYVAEALLCWLELYLNDNFSKWVKEWLNPHSLFQNFAKSISFDYQVVIDLIMSSDNCFLLYFLRYLKLLVCDVREQSKDVSAGVETVPAKSEVVRQKSVESASKMLVEYSSSSDDDSDPDSEERPHVVKVEEEEKVDDMVTCVDFEAILNLCEAVHSVICKLHAKRVFPFNPKPLLKLLERLSQVKKMQEQ